jgi:IS30 family transposase
MQRLTVEQQVLVWEGWRRGESLRLIARNLGSQMQHVRRFLIRHGGIRPPERVRHRLHLTAAEREEISRGIAGGKSARMIAHQLGRSPSSVSEEIRRNGGRAAYRAVDADLAASERARRPKPSRLDLNPRLRQAVAERLEQDWSPQQIAASLRLDFPDDPNMRYSHEAIYRTIYTGSRKALGNSASRHLRSGRTLRQPKMKRPSQGRGRLRNMVSIHDRPVHIEDRLEVGHWEGDLVMGRRPSAVATLVERTSRLVRIVALPAGVKAEAVRVAIASDLAQLPPELRRSLTWDRGVEMAEHQQLTRELSLPVYFCDSRKPWQRGTNENTNRLLRQYLSKTANLTALTRDELDAIERRLNSRPRRVLNWGTPSDVLAARLLADANHVASAITPSAALGPYLVDS